MQEKIWDKQVYIYKNNTLVYSTNSNTGIRVSAFSGLECWNGVLEWSEALEWACDHFGESFYD